MSYVTSKEFGVGYGCMIIETTFMKFGKGPARIIGKTTNPRTIQIWGKSQRKCSEVIQNLDELRNSDEPNMTKHKGKNTASDQV